MTSVAVATNPILPGCYPDPTICRVGDDYYLVASTFEYFPGLPIFHSTNLVDWTLIDHVITEADQLDYTGIQLIGLGNDVVDQRGRSVGLHRNSVFRRAICAHDSPRRREVLGRVNARGT